METTPLVPVQSSNPIDAFIAYLEKNHQYINQVYIFFAVISVVLVFMFDGLFPALFAGLFTTISTLIGLWIIGWLNTTSGGKYHLFGWILVGMSIASTTNQLLSYLVAKPKQVVEEKAMEAFRSFQRSQKY